MIVGEKLKSGYALLRAQQKNYALCEKAHIVDYIEE